ncbi:hypothetical protein MRB53_011018 [Persea americana]|uniref:Uncharacterized protein n=1 Tax=Persea americana TaxID=3435 RepID=A0ACC2LTP4_PERAE|nr:hypothetical protein MRB53_011018 [Persea americana]|eukprot:TRINITY_DN4427_c0_g1_i1.p1 TRINITY_DN4427_c0_g1~~TRINITY_DN4427_c0_g1_i1.p1  ORF type:complete len:431 (+),score=72.61 TRINITY_DN4427_c0_g1_i1:149-1441(+)
MSAESIERNATPLFYDPQPISVPLPTETESYAEILLGLRRCFPPEPFAVPGETNGNTVSVAAAVEAVAALWKARRSGVSPPLEASAALLQPQVTDPELSVVERASSGDVEERTPGTAGSRRGRKRKTEEEQEEFWSRRPDWLPEGWTTEVKVRTNGATAGMRDRYYFDPKSGHRFRSRKEVEKFTRTGEVPKNKHKPKTEDSNVVHASSEPPQSSSSEGLSIPYVAIEDVPKPNNMMRPPALEFFSRRLPSFKSSVRNLDHFNVKEEGGAGRNQQLEVGETIIEQYERETVGIQQSVPSDVVGLGTIFNLETENETERSHQSEIGREEEGAQKSKAVKKINWKKEARGRGMIIQQSELVKEAGLQQSETEKKEKSSEQPAPSNISGHEASSSRTKKKAPRFDRGIFLQLGREICKRASIANSKTGTTNHS